MLPSTARTSAPGPLIVTFVRTSNSPLVSVMAPEIPVALMVSPLFAIASACRNDPGPLSSVLVTVMIVASAGMVAAHNSAMQATADLTSENRAAAFIECAIELRLPFVELLFPNELLPLGCANPASPVFAKA